MDVAPIVLFVYNRPWHTRQTLLALSVNKLASESTLYVYADGPKENASVEDLKRIAETRAVLRETKWCKEVIIEEAVKNKGLANSVIDGIGSVLSKHDKVIVLEDDIITAKGFLKFLNEALTLYQGNEKVAGVSGWSFSIDTKQEIYFSRVGACWGWGTWKRTWEQVNFDTNQLIEQLKQTKRVSEFNVDDSFDFFNMLNQQVYKQVDSWAIRFYANYFLNKSLFLFPQKSLVQNIGLDGSGTHSKNETDGSMVTSPIFQKQFVDLKEIPVVEMQETRKKITQSFQSKARKRTLFFKYIIAIKNKIT